MSLLHKIFGSPTDQSAKLAPEEAPRDAAVSPAEYRDEPRSAGAGFADAHADEPATTDDEFIGSERDDEPAGTSEERPEREQKRGRRRRRGGRGRGRSSGDRRGDERSSARRGEGESPRTSSNVDDEFADDLLVEEDSDDSLSDDAAASENGDDVVGAGAARGVSSLQRSIPTWDEAIGFIVDSNMQNRSQRRPPSRSGGREGSRGRSRGRNNN